MNEITYDNNKKCTIGDMCMGTVFYYENNWYMLTDETSQDNQDKKYLTVVNLATGELGSFYCNYEAEVFNGILHINCRQ